MGTELWLWRHSGNSHVACWGVVTTGEGHHHGGRKGRSDYVAKRHPEREAQKATWHRAMALKGLTQPCKLGEDGTTLFKRSSAHWLGTVCGTGTNPIIP